MGQDAGEQLQGGVQGLAAGYEGVYVGMQVELVSKGLHHSDHSRAKALLLADSRRHQVADGLPRRRAQGAEQLSVVHEVGAQELGHREHPLCVADVGEQLVWQEGGEGGCPLGPAGRAQTAALAGEGEQELLRATDASKAVVENAAVEVAGHHAVDETAPEAVTALEALLPASLDAIVEGY